MNIKWVHDGKVFEGNFCTAQGKCDLLQYIFQILIRYIILLQAFCNKLGIPGLHWLLWHVLASFEPSDMSLTCHHQGHRDPYVRSSLVGVTSPPIFRRLHRSRSHVARYLAFYYNNGDCLYQWIQFLLPACWGKPFVHIVQLGSCIDGVLQ